MKHFFTLIIAMFLAFAASAQTVTWCPPGAEWHYEAGTFSMYGFVNLKYASDTVVAGRNCKKLIEHIKGYEMNPSQVEVNYFRNHFTYDSLGIVYGYAKWYDYVNNTQNFSWDTLYNFNAVSGDKWTLYRSNGGGKITVLNTGNSTIQNTQLKWLAVEILSPMGYFSDTIYERIGHIGYNYPFAPSVMESDPLIWNFCNYSDSTFVDWGNTDSFCSSIPMVSASKPISTELVAYPNPVSDQLTVQLRGDTDAVSVELFDVFGRQIYQHESLIAGTELNIDFTGISSGVYILKTNQLNQSGFTRIIKQ